MPDRSPIAVSNGEAARPSGARRSVWQTVRGYLALPHLTAVVLVELATIAFAGIAWAGVFQAETLARLILAMLGAQLVIGVTNDIADLEDDARYKPTKPLASGVVSMRGARLVLFASIALLASFGLSFGPASFALLLLGTGLGIAYDLRLKRTAWSWLPYLLALPLLPIWVFVSLGRPEPALLLLYPLGALATIGVHFAQALPDTDVDRQAGLDTLTSRLGAQRVFTLAWLAALSAPILAWSIAGSLVNGTSEDILVVAVGTTLFLMACDAVMAAFSRRLAYRACFPLVAVSTLASGLAWTIAATS